MFRRCFLGLLGALVALLPFRSAVAETATEDEQSRRFFHPGHNCPNCGRVQTVIYSAGPGRYHTHRCGNTLWYH